MARPLRPDFAGAIHHVTDRGNRRQEISRDPPDYRCLLYLVAQAVKRFKWLVHEYCLMPNHYHFVIETPEAGLSRGMQLINGRYAQLFNHRGGLDGHLFQGRFKSFLVESAGHRLWLTRYIARNPVEAGLCADPREWRWSSFGALRRNSAPDWLAHTEVLALFASDPELAAARYSEHVLGDV